MIITTNEIYEIGWFVFKPFAAYRIISAICATIFTIVQCVCNKKNRKNKITEIRNKIVDKEDIEIVRSNYKATRMGFMNDDQILNKKED